MKFTKTRVSVLVMAVGMFVSLQPAFGKSGSKIKWLGKGKFGVAVGSTYSVNASDKNAKVTAEASPYLKGKVFGKTFTVIGLDTKLGNYNNTEWDNDQRVREFDQNGIGKWKYYGAVRPFGVTVGFGDKNFISKKGNFDKSYKLYSWGKYYKRTLLKFSVPAIFLRIQISVGVTGYIEFKPTITRHGITALNLTATPKAAMGTFIEGAANLLLIRGGIGANLTLIEGYGGLRLSVNLFPGIAAVHLISGVDVLKGKVYVFVDRISIRCCFKKRWKRTASANLFNWAGQKARQFAAKEDEWRWIGKGRAGFSMHYDIRRTVKDAKYDPRTQSYVYDGWYENGMPKDVRGLGASGIKFKLFENWKKKHFAWMGKEQSTELWSHQFYDYYKVMDNIRKKLD